MKICQVSAFFAPHTGGSERYAGELSKYLTKRGHEVHVYTSRLSKDDPSFEEKDGLFIHRFATPRVLWGVNPLSVMMQGFMDEEFDVIHAHSYIFASSNQAALTRLLRKTPLILHLHGGIEASIPPGGFADRFKIHFKKAVYDRSIGKMTMAAADVVASVSKKDLELAEKSFGVPHKKLSWIPNAVDTLDFHNGTHDLKRGGFHVDHSGQIRNQYAAEPRISASNQGGQSSESKTVAFIGRLEHWKGIMTFLKMAEQVSKKVHDVEFIAVGGGSLLRSLKESRRYEGGRIRLMGPMPHGRIAGILQKCAMLVLPSYMEGLPTVCLESLASEVPVVASAVGGVSEVVIDNQTGFLIQPGDVDSCTKRVQFLLNDDDLRMEMGRNGRHLIERYYTWDKVTERVEEAYRGLATYNAPETFS